MRTFYVSHKSPVDGEEATLEVMPLEVLLSVDGCAADSSVSYFPTKACMASDGHVIKEHVASLEQAIAAYALMLHESGRMKGKPLGYILPCISVSYGTGVISVHVEDDDDDMPF